MTKYLIGVLLIFAVEVGEAPATGRPLLSGLAKKFVTHLGEEAVQKLMECLMIKTCPQTPDKDAFHRLPAIDQDTLRRSFAAPKAIPFKWRPIVEEPTTQPR